MSMQSHYCINVAKRVKPSSEPFGPYYEHFFATSDSASSQARADVLNEVLP